MLKTVRPGVYTLPSFPEPVLAALSGRQFSNELRNNFLQTFDLQESELFRVRQTHSALLRVVDEHSSSEEKPEGDALLTNQKNRVLGILTADCFPIFVFDPAHQAIALIHAGWRGISQKIVTASIERMVSIYETRPADLQVAIGPAIRFCCFEVGEEMKSIFPQAYRIPAGKSKAHVDLTRVLRLELRSLGIQDKNVWDSGVCTSCDNRLFFSARCEKGSKERILSVLALQ